MQRRGRFRTEAVKTRKVCEAMTQREFEERAESVVKELDLAYYRFVKHDPDCINPEQKKIIASAIKSVHDEAVEEVLSAMKPVVEALKIYDYYYPIRRRKSIGGGQADTTLKCGHIGRIGAKCCKKCADKTIDEALANLPEEVKEGMG